MVVGSAVAVSLVGGGLMASPVAAQDDCVAIYGGEVLNETVIDLSANAGTAISDASAGSNNAATTGGGNADALDVASAGNGGVASAAADGGAIIVGDINSGGNAGNAISVGDTVCAEAVAEYVPEEKKPAAVEVAPVAAAPAAAAPVGAAVVALPDTGVGIADASALFALITSAGAAAASLGLRRR
jgi:hypothetical protein